jgi:hypothetical protein
MAKRNNNLSGLLNNLSAPKVNGQSLGKLLTSTNLIAPEKQSAETATKPSSSGDTRTSAMDAKDVPVGINFGSPSSNTTSTSKSGSEWANLLTQTASGGVGSTISGGLSSIAGLGGLIAGIASLFGGGKSTPPPLVEFQLPSSQTQTVYVSSNGSSTYQGGVTGQAPVLTSAGPIYNNNQTPQPTNSASSGQSLQYHSTQIAQAVKTALLNSSTLNDVITEI